MSHNLIAEDTPETAIPAPDPGRDVVLTGELMPPSELPPLHATLAPLRPAPPLDLPARMPAKRRPQMKFEDDTETMLNEMIGDCHFLMREVAYRCIAQSTDNTDRLDFLRGALDCAAAGSKIADSIARLRAVPLDDDRRTAIMLETTRLLEETDPAKMGDSVKQ